MNKTTFAGGGLSDRFDLAVAIVVVVLIAALGLTIVRGDQIGLQITSYTPRDAGSMRASIQMTFDEPLTDGALDPYFSITPPVQGVLTVKDRSAIFRPTEPLVIGDTYTVQVRAGLQSAQTDRALKTDVSWQFTVRTPRLAYMKADPNDPINYSLFLVDPKVDDSEQQLVASQTSIVEFDVSPDGMRIAYSEYQQTGSNSLFEWNAATGKTSLLYACPDAVCGNPVWRPDGNMIAFERSEVSIDTGVGVARVWVLDLVSNTVRPLFKDSQRIGFDPRWSPDGTKLAVYSQTAPGIVVHDFVTDTDKVIETTYGQLGDFSPNGQWLFFPAMVQVQDKVYAAHFVLADLTTEFLTQRDTVPKDELSNDVEAAWLDNETLIIARRPPYQANSGGVAAGPQLYKLDIATGAATALLIDENYSNGSMTVSPDGSMVAFQRFALGKPGARPELWVLDLATGEAKQAANDSVNPRWMP
jgi:Tol biopolymer transport system component